MICIASVFAASFIAFSSAPLGVLLVLRRQALIADALSHALMPSYAIGFWILKTIGINVDFFSWSNTLLAMSLAATFTGIAMGALQRFNFSKESFFASFSLCSMALAFLFSNNSHSCMHLLLGKGNPLTPHVHHASCRHTLEEVGHAASSALHPCLQGFESMEFWMIVGFCLLSLWMTKRLRWRFVAHSFDPIFFKVQGESLAIFEALFWGVFSLNLMMSTPIFGTLFAIGFMILPALVMQNFHLHVQSMMKWASWIGAISVLFGAVLSQKSFLLGVWGVVVLGGMYLLALTKKIISQKSSAKKM